MPLLHAHSLSSRVIHLTPTTGTFGHVMALYRNPSAAPWAFTNGRAQQPYNSSLRLYHCR